MAGSWSSQSTARRIEMRPASCPAPTPAPPRPAALAPRERTCQFIAGEKGVDFTSYSQPGIYCGKPVRAGSSWCPEHHRLCWLPDPRRVKPEPAGEPLATPMRQPPKLGSGRSQAHHKIGVGAP
jgi:hypothetical protein